MSAVQSVKCWCAAVRIPYSVSYMAGRNWGSFPEVKRPEREAEHSPRSSAEFKNARTCTPTPYVFIVWCLIKQRIQNGIINKTVLILE